MQEHNPIHDCESCPPKILADRYRVLFENSSDAILILEEGKFIDCNIAAVEMLRCENKEAVLQLHPSQLSPQFQPDGQASFEKANEMISIAIENGSHRFEWDHLRADGDVFPVEVLLTIIPSENSQGLVTHIHTVWRDITDRKHLENELRHSQKMETIGKLSGGIAHDFNNQLVPILGYCEILAAELKERPDLVEIIEEINHAGIRAAELVKKLMVFSRKEKHQEITVDLNSVVSRMTMMLDQLIGEDTSLNFHTYGEPLLVKIDPADIEQVILNIATNARDAMPDGGIITIRLNIENESPESFACLEVLDQGIGMDAETLEKIFVPFFTSKGVGAGTGLGLSNAFRLVKKANGVISAQSIPGEGSTFKILLPIASGPATEKSKHQETSQQQNISNTKLQQVNHILVVEDDIQIAKLICKVLKDQKIIIYQASNGYEALELLKVIPKPDLILTDVVMSKMSGPKMVKSLRPQEKDIPVLFMSGYTDNRLATHDFDINQTHFLCKPFTPSELIKKIRDSLPNNKHAKLSN